MALRAGLGDLGGGLRRAREVEGSVLVSPYGKRRVRERSEQGEQMDSEERKREERKREESEETDGMQSRRGCELFALACRIAADWCVARTPMRESTGRASPSPAPQE